MGSDIEANEAFPARETNPADLTKVEGYKDQRAAKQMRPGHRTNKIHPGCPGVNLGCYVLF